MVEKNRWLNDETLLKATCSIKAYVVDPNTSSNRASIWLKDGTFPSTIPKQFRRDKFVIPIALPLGSARTSHWASVCVDKKSRQIVCFDPLGKERTSTAQILDFAQDWLTTTLGIRTWVAYDASIRVQEDSFSCGYYAIAIAHAWQTDISDFTWTSNIAENQGDAKFTVTRLLLDPKNQDTIAKWFWESASNQWSHKSRKPLAKTPARKIAKPVRAKIAEPERAKIAEPAKAKIAEPARAKPTTLSISFHPKKVQEGLSHSFWWIRAEANCPRIPKSKEVYLPEWKGSHRKLIPLLKEASLQGLQTEIPQVRRFSAKCSKIR